MIENMGQAERKVLMDTRLIEDLGKILFTRSVCKIKRLPVCPWPVVGFDTEYTSRGRQVKTKAGVCRFPTLLSFQLHTGEKGAFYEIKRGDSFDPVRLYQECCALLGEAHKDIYLAVYFSLAELQFLPVLTEGFRLNEYSRGSTDCSFRAGNGNLHIFDLWRWFDGASLARAAAALGYKKLDQNTKTMTRARNNTAKGKKYAIHDAYLCWQICHDVREVFLQKTGVDPLTTKTPASASAKAFRALHVRSDIYCDEDRARRAALHGLWGGRAEVFSRGTLSGEFTEYDFISAYPTAAMRIGQFPCQGDWREFSTLKMARKMIGGFVNVRFTFPQSEQYPCLPVQTKYGTIYSSAGESWCSTYEAILAEEMGAKITVLEGWGYKKGTKILADYLKWTMDERKKSQGAARQMWKLLSNSLVGKLAQRGWHADTQALFDMAEEMEYEYLDEFLSDLNGLSRREREALGLVRPSVGPIFLPEWNGLITGYTRAALSQVLKSGQGVYCHTDSIWCKKKPRFPRLPIEAKGTGPVTIIRTRFACIGEPVTKAGLASKAIHMPFHSVWNRQAALQMIQRFIRKPGTFTKRYKVNRPLHWKEAAALRVPPGTWITQDRDASTFWDHKRRLSDGGFTRPWTDVLDFEAAHKALQAARRRAGEYVDIVL